MRHRHRPAEQVPDGDDAVDEGGQQPHRGGVLPLDAVEGDGAVDHPHRVVAVKDAGQRPVEATAPGAVGQAPGPPLLPMVGVEAPADVAVVDDAGDGRCGVEIEPEAPLHHRAGDQLPDGAGLHAGVGELEHGGGEPHQRVDRRRGTVGDTEPQVGHAIGVVAVACGEGRFEQWGERAEVGGHDDDVPRLERRVVGE